MKNRMMIVVVIAILLLVGYVVSEHFNKKGSNQEITIEEVKEIEEQPKEETVTIETKASKKESTKTEKNTKKAKKSPSKATKKTVSKKKVVKKTQKVPSYNKDDLKSYAHDLVISYGWTEKDYNALVKIINHESGWRVTAENKKSKAYGLCQALPASKMKSAGNDYRTNGKTQLKWCVKYIKSRYGSPTKAWAFWQKHHWY